MYDRNDEMRRTLKEIKSMCSDRNRSPFARAVRELAKLGLGEVDEANETEIFLNNMLENIETPEDVHDFMYKLDEAGYILSTIEGGYFVSNIEECPDGWIKFNSDNLRTPASTCLASSMKRLFFVQNPD